jgi:hypothetical protein
VDEGIDTGLRDIAILLEIIAFVEKGPDSFQLLRVYLSHHWDIHLLFRARL